MNSDFSQCNEQIVLKQKYIESRIFGKVHLYESHLDLKLYFFLPNLEPCEFIAMEIVFTFNQYKLEYILQLLKEEIS